MSKNMNLALWMPGNAPQFGDSIVITGGAGPYQTNFAPAGGGGGGPGMVVGTTAPVGPTPGDMWMDISDPALPALKIYQVAGGWVIMGTSKQLPDATAQGQVVQADAALNWVADQNLDNGRY